MVRPGHTRRRGVGSACTSKITERVGANPGPDRGESARADRVRLRPWLASTPPGKAGSVARSRTTVSGTTPSNAARGVGVVRAGHEGEEMRVRARRRARLLRLPLLRVIAPLPGGKGLLRERPPRRHCHHAGRGTKEGLGHGPRGAGQERGRSGGVSRSVRALTTYPDATVRTLLRRCRASARSSQSHARGSRTDGLA